MCTNRKSKYLRRWRCRSDTPRSKKSRPYLLKGCLRSQPSKGGRLKEYWLSQCRCYRRCCRASRRWLLVKGTILPNNLEIHRKHMEIGSRAPAFVSDLSNRRKRDLIAPTLLGRSRKRLNIY